MAAEAAGPGAAARSWLRARPWLRVLLLVLYDLAILAAVAALYGTGRSGAPPFVYQGF